MIINIIFSNCSSIWGYLGDFQQSDNLLESPWDNISETATNLPKSENQISQLKMLQLQINDIQIEFILRHQFSACALGKAALLFIKFRASLNTSNNFCSKIQ